MYIYIYDSFINEGKNQKIIAGIETRVTDLGLNGKIYRLGVIKSITNLLEDEIKRGAKTIIGVGNDFLFSQIINSIIKIGDNNNQMPIIGFIPVGKNNNIAKYFGIKLENAHAVISARRIKQYSLGKINNNYFLSSVKISTANTAIRVDNSYDINFNKKNDVYIINLPLTEEFQRENTPLDKLKLYTKENGKSFFSKTTPNESFIPFQNLKILDQNTSVLVDENYYIKAPLEICASEKKINIIISKDKKDI